MVTIKDSIKKETKDELFKEYGINDEIDTQILEFSVEKATAKYWDPNIEKVFKPKYHSGKSGMVLVEYNGKRVMFKSKSYAINIMNFITKKYHLNPHFELTKI